MPAFANQQAKLKNGRIINGIENYEATAKSKSGGIRTNVRCGLFENSPHQSTAALQFDPEEEILFTCHG